MNKSKPAITFLSFLTVFLLISSPAGSVFASADESSSTSKIDAGYSFTNANGSDASFPAANSSQIQLTSGAAHQASAVWSNTQIDLNFDFSLSFNVYSEKTAQGGSGITFTMQNDAAGQNAIGDGDACLGVYQCTSNGTFINNAMTLEFDTDYTNTPMNEIGASDLQLPFDQNGSGHIAILYPSSSTSKHYNVQTSTSQPLENSQWRSVTVSWNASAKLLSYTVEGFASQSHNLNGFQSIFKSDKVYWGFTSSTTEAGNTQKVEVTSIPEQSPKIVYSIANLTHTNSSPYASSIYKNDMIEYTLVIKAIKAITNGTVTLPSNAGLDYVKQSLQFNNQVQDDTLIVNQVIDLPQINEGSSLEIKIRFLAKEKITDSSAGFTLRYGGRSFTSNQISLFSNNSYTVLYHSNEAVAGTPPADSTAYEYGESIKILSENSLTNGSLSFLSWNTKADGTGASYYPDQIIKATQSLDLYALWVTQSYSLEFVLNQSSAPYSGPLSFKVSDTQPFNLGSVNPVSADYFLSSWNSQQDGSGTSYTINERIQLTENLKLYGQWSKHTQITLTFSATDYGSIVGELVQVRAAGKVLDTYPTVIADPGYRFTGWYVEDMSIDPLTYKFTSDTAIVARFATIEKMVSMGNITTSESAANLLGLTFDLGDHGKASSPLTVFYPKGAMVTYIPYIAVDEGYHLIGWSSDDRIIDFNTYTITENTILVAIYEKNDSITTNNEGIAVPISSHPQSSQLKWLIFVLMGFMILLIGIIILDIKRIRQLQKEENIRAGFWNNQQ